MSIDRLYMYGMKRNLPISPTPTSGASLELGPGNSPMGCRYELDLPKWNAETDDIPHTDGSIDYIYAWHFFEHLSYEGVIRTLRECQRVLSTGGTLTLMVPWYRSQMAFQDLDHKTWFTERTWEMLFNNEWYDKDKQGWLFDVGFNFIMGEHERNLALFTQLVRL